MIPSAVRSSLEKATHRMVLRRRLPRPFDVPIYVSSESGLRYLKPSLREVDPPLLALASEVVTSGAVVWDIGANVGLFAFAAAVRAGATGQVIAVEADTYNVGLLRRSCRRQPASSANVSVLPVAISNRAGIASFQIASRSRSTNAIEGYGTSQMGGVRETQVVPTLTLDLLAEFLPMPDVIKIDVEGAEALVLGGAEHVLASHPVLVCEVAATNADVVREALTPFGYRFYDGDAPSPRTVIERPTDSLLAVVH